MALGPPVSAAVEPVSIELPEADWFESVGLSFADVVERRMI
jgi:hypothetical protein